jgi:hypothetical protein
MGEVSPQPPKWHVVLIGCIGIVLLVGCWNAPFIHYDDDVHIAVDAMPQIFGKSPLWSAFIPRNDATYLPLTIISYRFDYLVFHEWIGLSSWAPGVRFMTLVYHGLTALLVWQVMLMLGLGSARALFIAVVFAVHPLACETVCWASERKNAVAALFGYAALWVWFRRGNNPARTFWTAVLYALALMGKPSALGLLPILLIYEFMGGAAWLQSQPSASLSAKSDLVGIAARSAPMVVISAVIVAFNLHGHSGTLVTPPGGSVFTAMLTDLDIISRYLFNLLAPVGLSAVYFVDPIRSLFDLRVLLYGALLLISVVVTIRLAENPRRAAFGWLFFLGSLGPNLNLIAISCFMQDRYVYLGTPGLLLVIVEVAGGISRRMPQIKVLRPIAVAYVLMLVALSVNRSYLWRSMEEIFADAVVVQPKAAYAHFGVGSAYAQRWNDLGVTPGADSHLVAQWRQKWLQEWRTALDCPDAGRNGCYWQMASTLAEEHAAIGDWPNAEHYWQMMAYPPKELPDNQSLRAVGLRGLSVREIGRSNFAQAYKLAQNAVEFSDEANSRIVRAKAAIRLASQSVNTPDATRANELYAQARADLNTVPKDSPFFQVAIELEKQIP